MKELLYVLLIFIGFSCVSDKNEILNEALDTSEAFLSDSNTIAAKDPYVLVWSWDGEFSAQEKEKCMTWITQVHEATTTTLGEYPFDIHVTLIRSNSEKPIPFGFARRRNNINQVHFYVNPTASIEELMSDWTAPHEFSHLAIPFITKKNKWFSEGFATFLSRQIMIDMGLYSQTEFDSLYHSKIANAKQYYNSETKTIAQVSDSLMKNHIYAPMYWAGSSFLFTIDKRLRAERGYRFVQIMREYQICCRQKNASLLEIINSFDEIIGDPWCANLMKIYKNKPVVKALELF